MTYQNSGGPSGTGYPSAPMGLGLINGITAGLKGYLQGKALTYQRMMAQAMMQRNNMLADARLQHYQAMDDASGNLMNYRNSRLGLTADTATTADMGRQRSGLATGLQFAMTRPPEERPALISGYFGLYPDAAKEYMASMGAGSPGGAGSTGMGGATAGGGTGASGADTGTSPAGASIAAPSGISALPPGVGGTAAATVGMGTSPSSPSSPAGAEMISAPPPSLLPPSSALPSTPSPSSTLAPPSGSDTPVAPPSATSAGGAVGTGTQTTKAAGSAAPNYLQTLMNSPLPTKPMTDAERAADQQRFRDYAIKAHRQIALMPVEQQTQAAIDLNNQATAKGLPPVFMTIPGAQNTKTMPLTGPQVNGPSTPVADTDNGTVGMMAGPRGATTKQFTFNNPPLPISPQDAQAQAAAQAAIATARENNARASLEEPKFGETVRHNKATEANAAQRIQDQRAYQQGELNLGVDRNALARDRLGWQQQTKSLGSPMEAQRFVAARNGDIARYREAEQKLRPVPVVGIDHDPNSPTHGQRIVINPTPEQIQRYQNTASALEANIQNAAQLRDGVIKAHGLPSVPSSIAPPTSSASNIPLTLPPPDSSFGAGGITQPSLIAPPSPGAPTATARIKPPPVFQAGGGGVTPPAPVSMPHRARLAPPPSHSPSQNAPRPIKPGTTIRSKSGKTAFTVLG